MTKKDYIKFADMFSERFNKLDRRVGTSIAEQQELLTIIEDTMAIFSEDNPRFDKQRFIQYINTKTTPKHALLF